MSFFEVIRKRIFFSEAAGLIKLGRTRIVESHDRLDLPNHLSAYQSPWNEALIDWTSNKKLYFSLFRAAKKVIWTAIGFQVLASLFSFATPILVNQFVTALQLNDWSQANLERLILFAIAFGVCGMGNGLAIQHYFHRTLNFYQVTTNILNRRIFNHALQLSTNAKQKYQVGDIVNFMSSDTEAVADASITSIDLGNAAVLLMGCSGLLFYYIGWSALVAVAVMAILVPLTQILAKKFMHLEEEMMAHRDTRMTLMTQVLNSIRVVKYFNWEKSISTEVNQVRDKELLARTKLAKAEVSWGLIYTSVSSVVLFSALLTHYLRGLEITLPLVLTCVSIFSLMEDHFGGLSRFLSRFINIMVSGKRITEFLKSETISEFKNKFSVNDTSKLTVKNLNFSFQTNAPLFKDLNFELNQGESLAIVGPVGVGKSALLQIILSELNIQSGQVLLPAAWSKAFVPQEAYIVNSTLKENILFGQKNKSEIDIQTAIWASCLEADLSILPAGLGTEIGEKGVNLSGGQKQRVSLARAILADPDLVLLDDPLSAVDPRTEDLLCDRLLFGLWKEKTRIITTHRISHLGQFDYILFLNEEGYEFGRYQDLALGSKDFKNFLNLEVQNQKDEKELKTNLASEAKSIVTAVSESRVTVDEDRAIGKVDHSVFGSYLKALGGYSQNYKWILAAMFCSALAVVASPLTQKAWLTQAGGDVSPKTLVMVYGLLGLMTMSLAFGNGMLWAWRGIHAGRLFHERMLQAILKAEIRFFDSTPIGRILQRFSRDIESVDIHLQWSFNEAIFSLFHVVSSFVLIIFILPISIVLLVPIMAVYYFLQNDYRRVAREVKRLDSLARSPRYAHFKETLQGLPVIRAFNQQDWMTAEFLGKLENSTQMFYTHYMVNRWFSSRLPVIGGGISMITAGMVVLSSSKGWISVGLAGLVTLYALDFWRYLNWGVRIFSDLESRMTSVERLEFYAELPAEKEYTEIPRPNWPLSGSLTFKNVKLRYAEHLPYVLKNVSFHIPSGARAGIIGRTGSGKSTMFQAVYRFVHFDEGDIQIDGVSIKDVPLDQLRSQLAVIPQDPSLFMGTLRSNLDRYAEKSDAEIWSVLEKVELADFVRALPESLSAKITENGSNLSQGQRQLICLARALLMKVKIIFLDEATASVDLETDATVQKIIRESLDGITLVTIAHRLATLKDYDMIIELHNGEVANFQKIESGVRI